MADSYFSDQLAFNIARFHSYDKGKEYFEDGCVEKIWKEKDEYKAIVKGSHPYRVSLKFEDEELIYSCSCPFRERLDRMDLKELQQMWFQEGEDYYEDQYYEFSGESLDDVVDEFISTGEKYQENQNYGEALKIYQAIFESLSEKQKTIPGDVSDVSDWFGQEMDKVIILYQKILAKTDSKNLKKIGIKFICSVFEYSSIYIDKGQILSGLKQTIINKEEAAYALECLGFKIKTNLSIGESSLLAFLYLLTGDMQSFENISLKYLKENPGLTLDLLRYYEKNNSKDKIIQRASQVLNNLSESDETDDNSFYSSRLFNNKEIEIQIRRFLKNIYNSSENYQELIDNLEKLFLATGSLADYKELVKSYKKPREKEKFWEMIKKHFADGYEVKNIFNVFKLENQKQEILELIKHYPQADCFSEMVIFIRKDYSQECFTAYKMKIEEILKVTDVRKYSEAAYHLKRMKEIGLDKDFASFIGWIKTTYWRRRKLLEELQKNQI